jgi:hypothetical protein
MYIRAHMGGAIETATSTGTMTAANFANAGMIATTIAAAGKILN